MGQFKRACGRRRSADDGYAIPSGANREGRQYGSRAGFDERGSSPPANEARLIEVNISDACRSCSWQVQGADTLSTG